jgi:hypothetical protein
LTNRTSLSRLTYDLLLEYLSALQCGSWQTFKAAATLVADAQDPDGAPGWAASVMARDMAALGHIEFAFDTTLEWSINPILVAETPDVGPGTGVLCGIRTSTALEAVRDAASKHDVKVHHVSQDMAPTAICFEAASADVLHEMANKAGAAYQEKAANWLARVLPSLGSMYTVAPIAKEVSGFPIFRFDTANLEWQDTRHIDTDGAYKVDSYRPKYLIVWRGIIKEVSQSTAMYIALARERRRVLHYEGDTMEAVVPGKARPPNLHLRALVLSSGQLPRFDKRLQNLHFAAVSQDLYDSITYGLESLEEDEFG